MSTVGNEVSDAAWDAWLQRMPRAQFQQRAGWAAMKAATGWGRQRLRFDGPDTGVGGVQLLWKPTRIGRVGYVSKGPLLENETEAAVAAALRRLLHMAHALRLRGLIVQPPDHSSITSAALVAQGFEAKPIDSVIACTALADLTGGREGVLARMSRSTRRSVQLAGEAGLSLRWGSRSDLPRFFALMSESSRRQGSAPNPSRVELLEILFDRIAPDLHLMLVEAEGRVVAGLALIAQGGHLTFWKKGWDAGSGVARVNDFLNAQGLFWAADQGYAVADFAGMDPRVGARLAAGESLDEDMRRGRDAFNYRLGARPLFLPPAHLWLSLPVWRWAFRLARSRPALEKRLMARLQ